MIAFLTVPLALFTLALEGALLLCIVEGSSPYFSRMERFAAGFLVGSALSAFLLFFAVYAGLLPLTLTGFAVGHALVLGMLLALFFITFRGITQLFSTFHPSTSEPFSILPRWTLLLGAFLLFFAFLKILAASSDLLLSPAYFDDVYANWNMRAKVFYHTHSLLLDLPASHELFFGGRVPSYPLTIYFTKVWLAMVAGGWSEAAVNSVNGAFFLMLLVLFFSTLLREAGPIWSFSGLLLLLSFPLLLVHASSAYSDLAMAASLFLALRLLRDVLREEEMEKRRILLLLLGIIAAAMSVLKNEALLLYLPLLALFVLGGSLQRHRDWKQVTTEIWPTCTIVCAVVLPWVLFKVSHGLTFGNAQQIGGFSLMPHPEVIPAITSDLLYTGSYLLFFPALLVLLVLSGRTLRTMSLGIPLLFLSLVFLGQCLMYYLTPLALEAVRHTGFGRGVLQLLPSFAFFAVLLLRELLQDLPWTEKPDSVS